MAKKKIIFIVIAIIILIALFLPGYAKLQDLLSENKDLAMRIDALQASISELKTEKVRLESDIIYIEKIARQKLGLIKEGEKIIERE